LSWSCRKCLCKHCEHVWIAVSCSVKFFPNLEAAALGVFNRVLNYFPKASEHSFRLKRAFQRTLQFMSSSTTTPGAPSVPPPSADSRSSCDGLRPEPWHDRSPRRTATACGVPTRPSGQIYHEGVQAHTAALERAALMRIVKQVRATFGDALWADFVTHANARYIDAILRPFCRPDRLTPRYVYATPFAP
jgi:hypothetical protein